MSVLGGDAALFDAGLESGQAETDDVGDDVSEIAAEVAVPVLVAEALMLGEGGIE